MSEFDETEYLCRIFVRLPIHVRYRVVYTYDEFKRRKFDKLFHYIVDLLNILVPYVFHRAYVAYLDSIISHYFDVFKVNSPSLSI